MILEKGEKAKGQYYGENKFELQVKVHSGELGMTITKGSSFFHGQYKKSSEIKKKIVDLGQKKLNFFAILASVLNFDSFISVEFEALADNTIYSVRFK